MGSRHKTDEVLVWSLVNTIILYATLCPVINDDDVPATSGTGDSGYCGAEEWMKHIHYPPVSGAGMLYQIISTFVLAVLFTFSNFNQGASRYVGGLEVKLVTSSSQRYNKSFVLAPQNPKDIATRDYIKKPLEIRMYRVHSYALLIYTALNQKSFRQSSCYQKEL